MTPTGSVGVVIEPGGEPRGDLGSEACAMVRVCAFGDVAVVVNLGNKVTTVERDRDIHGNIGAR